VIIKLSKIKERKELKDHPFLKAKYNSIFLFLLANRTNKTKSNFPVPLEGTCHTNKAPKYEREGEREREKGAIKENAFKG